MIYPSLLFLQLAMQFFVETSCEEGVLYVQFSLQLFSQVAKKIALCNSAFRGEKKCSV